MYTYILLHVYICTYVNKYINISICICICILCLYTGRNWAWDAKTLGRVFKGTRMCAAYIYIYIYIHTHTHTHTHTSSIDMYHNDVGQESAQKFMKQNGDLKAATLYFAS
jgi:1,4-dihydroxy-2-naphthoate octaprenyltransferase